jgi:hypothetical protein
LLAFLDRPEISDGEALAGLLRPGNAGSNTAVDHIKILDLALANLPTKPNARAGASGAVSRRGSAAHSSLPVDG